MKLLWNNRSWILCGAGALFILTGGYGLFVPRIHGLNNCTEFVFFTWLVLLSLSTIAVGVGSNMTVWIKDARACGLGLIWSGGILAGSVFVNAVLEQDPCFAVLNWRAPFLRYDPDYGRHIENHEWVQYDEQLDLYYAGGPGQPIPLELQDKYGRSRF
ncbi:MAG: hypothetical protein ICCCNLDF_01652 [Planctomycetes bacterium]|nr:hypothetical protein [Planctomycetota bacterium]